MGKIQRTRGNCNARGFTLMEVIVSIAIIGISFVMVMQLFSGGLKASRRSCDYTRAVVHAKYKMEEIASLPVSGIGAFEDGFKWESVIEPYAELEESNLDLVMIKIKVFWDDAGSRQNSVELVSLKTVLTEESL